MSNCKPVLEAFSQHNNLLRPPQIGALPRYSYDACVARKRLRRNEISDLQQVTLSSLII